jgi:hypothetical protein
MDLEKVVRDLTRERDRLSQAIALLSGNSAAPSRRTVPKRAMQAKKRGGLTPEGRKRLSLAMKKRWAERRKKGS